MEPYADLEIKNYIEHGVMAGPKMHLDRSISRRAGFLLAPLHTLTSPEDAVRLVNYWADEDLRHSRRIK